MTSKRTLFENPPVNEVVFQVSFPELKPFGQPHIGIFWNQIRAEFPTIQAVPRIGVRPQQLLDASGFPDNRVWLIHRSGNQILQLQDDRFLFNWRKTGNEDSYPGFDVLYPLFNDYLSKFIEFLDDEEFPVPTINGFELSYINHIYKGLWQEWRDVGEVLSVLSWQSVDSDLSNLLNLRFYATSALPERQEQLGVSIESRVNVQTKDPLIQFEIKVTGRDQGISIESLADRFRSANTTINRMFVNATSAKAQADWKRK